MVHCVYSNVLSDGKLHSFFYLFTVLDSGLLFYSICFASSYATYGRPVQRLLRSSLLLLMFELHLDRIKTNQRTEYLDQRSFRSGHTHQTDILLCLDH